MGKTYKAVEITKPGTFRLVEKPVVGPGEEQVRIRVEACGVCHSDAGTVEGQLPGVVYPRVPGHEAIGRIEEVGRRVTTWKVGQRVGVGFFGGEDGTCETCRRGDTAYCQNPIITGVTSDGGYAEMMIAEARALALIPEELKSEDAAPLVCAGITTFNALRNAGRAGDTVAIQGIGGLGHLGVQYAKKMGFRTVAIGFGPDKEHLAPKLGAHIYIDAKAEDAGAALQKLGGADVDPGDRPQRSRNRQPASRPLSSRKARGGWRLRRSNSGQRSSADFWWPLCHRKPDGKSDRDTGHS